MGRDGELSGGDGGNGRGLAGRPIPRRQVLWGGLATGAGLVAGPGLLGCVIPDLGTIIAGPPGGGPLVIDVTRKEDLLELTFEFHNLQVVQTFDGAALTRRTPGNAFVVVVFGSQSTAERALLTGTSPNDVPLPLTSASAGPSRLGFFVPPGVLSIPYTTESLLSWTTLVPRLAPVALPSGASPSPAPSIREPHETETSIEMPWRLHLSPHTGLGWAHATGLVTHNGRTEVWHTRLGVRDGDSIDEWAAQNRTARAIWSPDFDPGNPPDPGPGPFPPTSLEPFDRHRIVEATSDFSQSHSVEPVQVNRMMLSSLGGWLDVVGVWEDHSTLESWRHLATMGRDHYVRVVSKGYLFPYGHAAALIEVSERRFEEAHDGYGGYLRKESFVVVRQPLKRYTGAVGEPDQGRAWPLRVLRATTLASPALDPPAWGWGAVGGAFVPTVDTDQPVPFHFTGKDWEDRDVDVTSPVVFVLADQAVDTTSAAQLVGNFNDLPVTDVLRRRDLAGQKVAVATATEPGDTDLDLEELVVSAASAEGATQAQLEAADQPRFFPTVEQFAAHLGAAEQTSGTALPAPTMELSDVWVKHGFDGDHNAGEVFAQLVGDPVGLEFSTDRSGGLAAPNMGIAALSRRLGPVGGSIEDLDDVIAGTFDPEDFFAEGTAKLLGAIELFQVIKSGSITTDGEAPRITTRPIHPDGDTTQPPERIVTTLEWSPGLQPDPIGLFGPHGDATFDIDATFEQVLGPPAASNFEIEGDLRNFDLNLIGTNALSHFMTVRFDQLRFTARSGQKTDIDVAIDEIEFAGPLTFVNRIREYLTFGGSGPFIDVQPSGVIAGYRLALPQIPIGALMLEGIALSGAVQIPFDGSPARLRFGLSERDDPFVVTYSCIGGGGYFAIAFGLDGLERFECAIELGAYASIDFGVASGSVSLSAGLHFLVERVKISETDTRDNITLTAYIRFVGRVEALRIVSISLELYLALGFSPGPPAKLKGTASVEVKVKVLVFEGSVKIEVERRLSSTPNDPTFEMTFDEDHWREYARAFAAVGGA